MQEEAVSLILQSPWVVVAVLWVLILASIKVAQTIREAKRTFGIHTEAEMEREERKKSDKRLDETLTGIKKSIEDIRDELGSVKSANIMQLGDQITTRCEKYLRLGYIPSSEMTTFQSMFTVYTELGGNHGVDTLVHKTIETLPIKSDVAESESLSFIGGK